MRLTRNSGLILSLDLTKRDEAIKVLRLTHKYADVIKVHYPLILSCGLDIVSDIKRLSHRPVIADFKLSCVPHINLKIMELAFNSGADAITVHGFIGPFSAKECVDYARSNDKGVFFITELTNPRSFTTMIAEDVARMSRDLGATGIQAPGNRPIRVRELRTIVGDDLLIISCGIGAQGGRFGQAIEAGADYEIVGRAIYEASTPRLTAQRISSILKSALEKRC